MEPQAGLVGLAHSKGTVGKAIRFGQRLRFPKQYCVWNHAFLMIDSENLIQMGGHGANQAPLSSYEGTEYALVKPDVEMDLEFAKWALAHHEKYGYMTIASEVVTMLTGAKIKFGTNGTMICSGLVAACSGIDEWRADPSHVTPAEIAMRWWTP